MGAQDERRTRPIVIVTGANAGVGFAICQRLLTQLVHRIPPDSIPQSSISRLSLPPFLGDTFNPAGENGCGSEFVECEGITLVLACRSVSKAEDARVELMKYLDDEVDRIRKRRERGVDGKDVRHAERFRENVRVVVHRLDLASVKSIFEFVRDVEAKYPYVSHLVCNAGVASFIAYDWPLAIKQLCTDFLGAVTSPLYKIQRIGELSEDGLGWVWQCNVFGHYVLFRLLEPLLSRYDNLSLSSSPARILWMTSVEALPSCYDPSDWQLVRNDKSYEASKFQIDLLVGWFEKQQQQQQQQQRQLDFEGEGEGGRRRKDKKREKSMPIRHFLCHPGIVRTNIAIKSLNSLWLDLCMQLSFLIAHFLGSNVHTMTPYKSAISAVHLMLVALPFITVTTTSRSSSTSTSKYQNSDHNSNGSINGHATNPLKKAASPPSPSPSLSPSPPSTSTSRPKPLKFGSKCNYWFREYVYVSEVDEWEGREDQAEDLVKHCEELFEGFRKKEEARLGLGL